MREGLRIALASSATLVLLLALWVGSVALLGLPPQVLPLSLIHI